jgi:hypothetical protein
MFACTRLFDHYIAAYANLVKAVPDWIGLDWAMFMIQVRMAELGCLGV